MKSLLVLILSLSLSASSLASPYNIPSEGCDERIEPVEAMALVKELIQIYQPEIFKRYGIEVELAFSKSCTFQATGGHDYQGKLIITGYYGALQDPSLVIPVFCHEVGHILGKVTSVETGVVTRFNKLDSVEGEADYFAGSCVREFYRGDEERAAKDLEQTFEFMYRKDLEAEAARNEIYTQHNGINPTYPSPNCRLLSALSGLRGEARPKCWYNPTRKTSAPSSSS